MAPLIVQALWLRTESESGCGSVKITKRGSGSAGKRIAPCPFANWNDERGRSQVAQAAAHLHARGRLPAHIVQGLLGRVQRDGLRRDRVRPGPSRRRRPHPQARRHRRQERHGRQGRARALQGRVRHAVAVRHWQDRLGRVDGQRRLGRDGRLPPGGHEQRRGLRAEPVPRPAQAAPAAGLVLALQQVLLPAAGPQPPPSLQVGAALRPRLPRGIHAHGVVCHPHRMAAHRHLPLLPLRRTIRRSARIAHQPREPVRHPGERVRPDAALLLRRQRHLDAARVHPAPLPLPHRRVAARQARLPHLALPAPWRAPLSPHGPVASGDAAAAFLRAVLPLHAPRVRPLPDVRRQWHHLGLFCLLRPVRHDALRAAPHAAAAVHARDEEVPPRAPLQELRARLRRHEQGLGRRVQHRPPRLVRVDARA